MQRFRLSFTLQVRWKLCILSSGKMELCIFSSWYWHIGKGGFKEKYRNKVWPFSWFSLHWWSNNMQLVFSECTAFFSPVPKPYILSMNTMEWLLLYTLSPQWHEFFYKNIYLFPMAICHKTFHWGGHFSYPCVQTSHVVHNVNNRISSESKPNTIYICVNKETWYMQGER